MRRQEKQGRGVRVHVVGPWGHVWRKARSLAEAEWLAHQVVGRSVREGDRPPAMAVIYKRGERVMEVRARMLHGTS
jgi:hypothetical protein